MDKEKFYQEGKSYDSLICDMISELIIYIRSEQQEPQAEENINEREVYFS